MVYIVYKTTCLINDKIYIGVHKTENPYKFDGYLGGGYNIHSNWYKTHPNTPIHFAILKYGESNFKREVLYIYETGEEAYNKEAEIVNLKFVESDNTYNVALGGKGIPLIPKPVYAFTKDGDLKYSFNSALEAAKSLETSESYINSSILFKNVCKNLLLSHSSVINKNDYSIKQAVNYFIYDANGTLILENLSVSEVINYLNTNSANLARATKLKLKINGMFITTTKLDHLQVVVSKSSEKLNRYTLNGEYIDSFCTIEEAKTKLGLKLASISLAIKLGRLCNGYRWTRSDNPPLFIETSHPKNSKKLVAVYTKQGKLVEILESVSMADKKYPGCRSVLKNKCKHSHGFLFKYI